MKALLFERSLPRFAAARVAATFGSGRGAGVGPLRLADVETPEVPGPGWHRVQPVLSGICGSDLATVDGRTSRYFEDLVSFPFVPGHEVVGTLSGESTPASPAVGAGSAVTTGPAGTRVVIEPVLGCAARGIAPLCRWCAEGRTGDCENVAFGHLRPGLQTGFCADTGGGWSTAGFVAHESQLHTVPDELTDADAVTVEPVACAAHAVLSAGIASGDTVGVVGAGTVGLLVVASLAHLAAAGECATPGALLVGARYAHQRRLAMELGATDALPPEQLGRAVRRRSRSFALGPPGGGHQRLSGGADVILDCVGSAESLALSLDLVRPRGRVTVVGMPGRVHLDLAPLWHREVALVGAYAYGTEQTPRRAGRRTFELALEVAAAKRTGQLVSATYPIERFEEALGHAGSAGRRGAVKIAFDLRERPPRRGDTERGPGRARTRRRS